MRIFQEVIRRLTMMRLGAGLRVSLARDEGQALVEYGLIIALIAAVVIGLIVTLGTQIKSAFSSITSQL